MSDGKRVTQIVSGGPINHGQDSRFDFEFADGSVEPFHCSFEALPKISVALKGIAEVTESLRRGLPKPPLESVLPHEAIDCRTGHDARAQKVMVQFQTKQGIPIQVSMDPMLAEKTIERLKVALGQMKSAPSQLS